MDNTCKNIMESIDLDAIFNEEWYKSLTITTLYALSHLNCTDEKIRDRLTLRIIDYNIEKAIKKAVLSNIIDSLPRTLDWKNIQATNAFTELKNIIDSYNVCPVKKLYKVKILVKKTSNLYNILIEWCKAIAEHYPDIDLTLTTTCDPNSLYLTLKKATPID